MVSSLGCPSQELQNRRRSWKGREWCSHVSAVCMRTAEGSDLRTWDLASLFLQSTPPGLIRTSCLVDLPKHQRRRPSPEILGFGFGFGVLLKESKSPGRWGSHYLLLWRGMCFPGKEDFAVIFWCWTTCKEGLKIETDFGDYLPFSHREICVFRNRKARRVLLMHYMRGLEDWRRLWDYLPLIERYSNVKDENT